MAIRDYISKDKIGSIAIGKYRQNGDGITFEDIEREFSVNKDKAQRKLKHFHGRGVLFTANDLIVEGITILKNTSPQQYFPTNIKAEIIEGLSKRKSVLVEPTGVNHSSTPLSSDRIVSQTLEGYVLPLLPQAPSYIHNIHMKVTILPEHYVELDLPIIARNKGKKTTQIIGYIES